MSNLYKSTNRIRNKLGHHLQFSPFDCTGEQIMDLKLCVIQASRLFGWVHIQSSELQPKSARQLPFETHSSVPACTESCWTYAIFKLQCWGECGCCYRVGVIQGLTSHHCHYSHFPSQLPLLSLIILLWLVLDVFMRHWHTFLSHLFCSRHHF